MRVSRRDFLRFGGLAISWLGLETATSSPVLAGAPAPDAGASSGLRAGPGPILGPRDAIPRGEVFGRSRGGQPLKMFQIGTGRRIVLLMGGQHGTPEANSVDLADELLHYFLVHPDQVPRNVTLEILSVTNPDGYLAGSRQYLTGVDPNRNWDSGNWDTDAYDSLGHFRPGLGGPEPMSEPETRALASWIVKRRPSLVINYHSAGGLVSTGQEGISDALAGLYAEAGDYPYYSPYDDAWWYPITGAMDGWLARMNIPDIFVELSHPDTPEFDDNLAGLTAVLGALA